MNITNNKPLLVSRHQLCILSIILSNNAGYCDSLIYTLSKR